MKKNYTLLSLILSVFAAQAQTTVVLPCNQDVELFSLVPNTPQNTGSYGNQLNANAWTYNGNPGEERSLLGFDLSQIPTGATIISATLKLYNNFYCNDDAYQNGEHSHVTNTNASFLQRVTTSWNEGTATWNNQPAATLLNQAILPEDTNPNENYFVNVRQLVQDMIDSSATSFGFMLRLQIEQHYACLLFASSRHPDTTLHPKLEITYNACVGLVLQPAETGRDVMLDTHNGGNTNYDGSPALNSTAWTDQSIPYQQRSLLEFDLASIPVNSVIQSAHLTLYNNYTDNTSGFMDGTHSHLSGDNQSVLQRITSSWQENTATWNNSPTSTTVNEVTLPQDTNPNQDYTIDVTQLVQDMVNNPTTSFGFMLRLVTEQHYRCLIFASSDHPNAALHPKLDICYKYDGSAGVANLDENNSFLIFPNPASDELNIRSSSSNEKLLIEIYDMLGKKIYSQVFDSMQHSISIREFPQGIYLARLKAGKRIFTQKLVIKK
jgi:hypothetical protein